MIGISTDKKAWTTQLICIFFGSLSSKKVRYFPCSILAEVRTNCTASWNHKPQLKRKTSSGDHRWPSNPKKVRPSVRSLSNPRWTPKLSQPSSNRRTGSCSTWNYWLYTCIGIFGCGVKLKVQICPEAIHAPRFISKHRSSRPIHRYGWPQNHPYLFLSHSNLSTYVELT